MCIIVALHDRAAGDGQQYAGALPRGDIRPRISGTAPTGWVTKARSSSAADPTNVKKKREAGVCWSNTDTTLGTLRSRKYAARKPNTSCGV